MHLDAEPCSGRRPGIVEMVTVGDTLGAGRRLAKAARRAQLLASARTVFIAQGYRGTAMDDIAEHAGVSKPVLYQHFPSKLDLYLAVLGEQMDAMLDSVRAAVSATTDNEERVRGAIAAYFDFVDSRSETFRLLFGSDLASDPLVRQRVRTFFAAVVAEGAVSIAGDTGTPAETALLLSAGLTGLAEVGARWWLEHRPAGGGPPMSKEDAVTLMSGLAWRGLSGIPRGEPL